MGTVIGGSIAVVKSARGIEVTTYGSELEAVKNMVNHGSLGGGSYYGCEAHVEALAEIERFIAEVRETIQQMEAEEDNGDED
jgi:hypothetical protein